MSSSVSLTTQPRVTPLDLLTEVAADVRGLELTDPVSGSIAAPGRPGTAFIGWLELHAALENICACADAAGAAAEPPLP